MKIKKLGVAMLTGVMTVGILGAVPTYAEDDTIKVGFVISDLANAFFARLIEGMENAAEAYDNVEFTAVEAVEVSDKITAIENLVSGGYDVVLCHVSDAEALKDAALSAEEEGTYFISYDTDIEGTSGFFGVDNTSFGYAIGEMAADWVNATFPEDQEVTAAFCNYPDYPFLVVREEGTRQALADLAPNVKFVAEAKAGYTPEGIEVGEAWSQSIPDVNLIVGINDAGPMGVYEVFNGAGINDKDKLGIFGADANDDAVAAIAADTTYKGTLNSDMVALAPDIMKMCVDLEENDGVLENRELICVPEKITIDNVEELLAKQE